MNSPTIVVSEWMDEVGIQLLRDQYPVLYNPQLAEHRDLLIPAVRDARALIVRNRTIVDKDLLETARNLIAVGRLGTGLDNIDTARAAKRGVKVTYAPGFNARAVAEWVIGAVLSLVRKLGPAHQHVFFGGWDRARFAGTELSEYTLGILGFGRIATLLSRYLQPLELKLVTYHPRRTAADQELHDLGVENVSLPALLGHSSILIVLLPLSTETRNMITEAELRKLAPGALLVVAGRGGVVDEEAALRLLREGHLGGVALDVFAHEPPKPGSLRDEDRHQNLLLSPHAAGWTTTCQRKTAAAVAADILRVLRGENARFPVE